MPIIKQITPQFSTNADLDLYVNSSTGDDNNDGRDASRAFATIQSAINSLPHLIKHTVVINISGTFSGSVSINNYLGNGGQLVIDGGADVTEVDGQWTSDVTSVSTIGDTSLALTEDEYKGYWIEVLTGSAAGQKRQIFSHTTTTFTLSKDFSVNPGTGATFRVVKPTTTIGGNAAWNLRMRGSDGQYCVFQNFTWTSSNGMFVNGSTTGLIISDVIFDLAGGASFNTIIFQAMPRLFLGGFNADLNGGFGTSHMGVSFRVPVNIKRVTLDDVRSASIYDCSFIELFLINNTNADLFGGCRIKQMSVYGITDNSRIFSSSSGRRTNKIDSATAVGLTTVNSDIRSDRAFEVSDCGSHGIELINSRFYVTDGVVSGTGNTGAGLYIHDMSTFTFTSGDTPTITGTVGDISLDGSTEESTWNVVASGTQINDTTQFVNVKEV